MEFYGDTHALRHLGNLIQLFLGVDRLAPGFRLIGIGLQKPGCVSLEIAVNEYLQSCEAEIMPCQRFLPPEDCIRIQVSGKKKVDPACQLPFLLECQIAGEVYFFFSGFDKDLIHRGDAHFIQFIYLLEKGLCYGLLIEAVKGRTVYEPHGCLEEQAIGFTGQGIPADDPSRRIRRIKVDPNSAQCLAVHPYVVSAYMCEHDRSVRENSVQVLL